MRVIQRGNGPCFAFHPLTQAFPRNLDGHVAPQSRIVGAVHLAHSPGADGRENLVGTQFLASRERHVI